MREKLMNVKRNVKLGLIKCGVMIGSIGTGLYVGMAQVMAEEDRYKVNSDIDPTKIKNKVLDFIFIILTIVGVGIAAMGLFKLVNSIREDRPEDLKAGIATLVAGALLVMAPVMLKWFGILQTTGQVAGK